MTQSDHAKHEGWKTKSWLHWLPLAHNDTHHVDGPTDILEQCWSWFDEPDQKTKFAQVIIKESQQALDSFVANQQLSAHGRPPLLTIAGVRRAHDRSGILARTAVIHYRCGDILTKPNGSGWRLLRFAFYLKHILALPKSGIRIQHVLILGQFDSALVEVSVLQVQTV
jgi:hypothetical protein